MSAEHFSVDGTLLKAWASMKSFWPKSLSSGEDPRNGSGEPVSAAQAIGGLAILAGNFVAGPGSNRGRAEL